MSIKKLLLSSAAGLLLAAPAFADGGPVPEPAPPTPPAEPAPEPEPEPEPAPPPPPPPADEEQFYIEGFGGVSFARDLSYGAAKFEMDTGWNAGGALGAHLNEHWDLEVDVFYSELGYEGFETSISGLSVMLDLLYNFNTGWVVDPYVGAGFGVTRVRYDGANQFPTFTGQEWAFGYQFMGGLMYEVTPIVDLFAEYRFHDIGGDVEIKGVPNIDYETHNISAGIRLNF
ncbi:MAG: outer membrane protein [Alphaproteobacteria bacterium]